MLEAVNTRGRVWAVRPKSQLGTCGFYPRAWTVAFVFASSEREAVFKAERDGLVFNFEP